MSAPPETADPAADLAECRARLAGGSRTFLAASWVLPRRVREPACALYAYCREADDAVDGAGNDAAAAVAGLRARLAAVYAGRPGDELADRVLSALVRRYAIPPALPGALIEGFAWDAEGRRYETLDELLGYAARVAGTVGAMMALLMGVRAPAALARACELGVAMQLSNIARDVGEDAALGRIYLPLAWLREAGIDADTWLAAPRHSKALAAVVERLLAAADVLYARVGSGVAQLPLGCRPGINAARFLYAEIGQEVRRRGCDALHSRAVVSRTRKAVGLLRAAFALRPAGLAAAAPPLPATAFLVDAVAAWPVPPLPAGERAPARWNLAARAERTIELFSALELRDRERRRHGWAQ